MLSQVHILTLETSWNRTAVSLQNYLTDTSSVFATITMSHKYHSTRKMHIFNYSVAIIDFLKSLHNSNKIDNISLIAFTDEGNNVLKQQEAIHPINYKFCICFCYTIWNALHQIKLSFSTGWGMQYVPFIFVVIVIHIHLQPNNNMYLLFNKCSPM